MAEQLANDRKAKAAAGAWAGRCPVIPGMIERLCKILNWLYGLREKGELEG